MKLTKILTRTLSLRLSVMLVCAIALLLIAVLVVMFHFSRATLREEAMHDAQHTLESTSVHIDNILLSVELTAGNFYYDLMRHIHEADHMEDLCRELVLSNRYIVGCAIAFKPYHFPGRENCMTYVRRKIEGGNWLVDNYDTLEVLNSFLGQPYTEQVWYTQPMETNHASWMEPIKNSTPNEALITFSLPIYDFRGTSFEKREKLEPIGVMGVDVPLARLSDFLLRTKPSANGYSVLLGSDGKFIVHPDANKLLNETVFTQTEHGADPSVLEVANAMVAGESGFKPYIMKGEQWYVIYKPFVRSQAPGRIMEHLGWSVGVAYPDSDIFNEYNRLQYILYAIVFFGLLLFFVVCQLFTHRQLQPLTLLTKSAQSIADGHYDETVPDTNREDEIGQLQVHFQGMQQALSTHIGKEEQLSAQLRKRGEELRKAYRQAQEADKMKTSFLHYMTNQMVAPSDAIDKSVTTICDHFDDINEKEVSRQAAIIHTHSDEILRILDHMLQVAESETRKEEEADE